MKATALICAPAALVVVLLGVGAAWADQNELAGGVLITHYVSQLNYTGEPTDWGAAYQPYAIGSSEEQTARIEGPRDNAIWYVIAAWAEPKTWCGVEFGFANYTASLFSFYDSGPLFPPAGGLELPMTGWPAPNKGTAFVTTVTPWSGNYVPVYWFGGYAYGPALGSTVIQIGIDPVNNVAEFSNCQSNPQSYAVTTDRRGGLGINTDGVRVHPVYVAPERVCCNPTTYACTIRTEAECLSEGGVWDESLTSCVPNPCVPTGACCYGTTSMRCGIMSEAECLAKPHPVLGQGSWKGVDVPCDPWPCMDIPERVCCLPDQTCEIRTEVECEALDGTWHSGYSSCSQAQCAALGACCVGEGSGVCQMAWEAECKALNGMSPTQQFTPGNLWHPSRTCDGENPCDNTPVYRATWGSIKRLYQSVK